MSEMYELSDELASIIDKRLYSRWLKRKAKSHAKRDRRRGNSAENTNLYEAAIHQAVLTSKGLDSYTGEQLNWSLIGTYDNEKSRSGRRKYKADFALLPTVDHVGDGLGPPNFKICGWRTNDAKHDLSHDDFIALCRRVIDYSDKCK